MLDLRLTIEDSPVGDSAIKVRCINPDHKDKVASMAVYPSNLHCFACGFHATGNTALALLLHTDEVTAARERSKYTTEAIDGYRERATQHARQSPLPRAHAWLFWNQGNQEQGRFKHRMEWFKRERGLTQETIDTHQIGHDGLHFTIPIFDEQGSLLSFRYRADSEYNSEEYVKKHKYSGMTGRNGRYLYPAKQVVDDTHDWIVLCEGEFDALRLWQEGVPAATLTNGAGQCKRLPGLLPQRIRHVYIATDHDEAGDIAAEETAKAANDLGMGTQRVWWSGEAKDVTEAYKAGWRFAA